MARWKKLRAGTTNRDEAPSPGTPQQPHEPVRSLPLPKLLAVPALGIAALASAYGVAAVTAEQPRRTEPITFEQRAIIPDLERAIDNAPYGSFTVDGGRVSLSEPGDDLSILLVDVQQSDGRITFVADEAGLGFGFVFRAQDEQNYWRIGTRLFFEGWSLSQVIDGEESTLGEFLKTSPVGEVPVTLELAGPVITATVADQTVTVTDPYLVSETSIGFAAQPESGEILGWSDVRVWAVS